jgi:hypothetical protein
MDMGQDLQCTLVDISEGLANAAMEGLLTGAVLVQVCKNGDALQIRFSGMGTAEAIGTLIIAKEALLDMTRTR